MGERLRRKQPNAFANMTCDMYFKIFSYLDINSFRVARSVSKLWRRLAHESREIRFRCHLTDDTIKTINNSEERLAHFKVHDFQGKDNKVVSSTRGIGRILRRCDIIELIGRNINEGHIINMMRYGVEGVDELVFQHSSVSLLLSVIQIGKEYWFLRKLTVHFYYLKDAERSQLGAAHFTKVAREAPKLRHLKVLMEHDQSKGRDMKDHYRFVTRTSNAPKMFDQYLAIAHFISQFKATLKILEILREYPMCLFPLRFSFSVNDLKLIDIERGLQEMNLNALHIESMMCEGDTTPFSLETRFIQQQKNLKDLRVDQSAKVILAVPLRTPNEALRNVFPTNCNQLVRVNLSLKCGGNEALDMGLFSQCPYLKTLWLAVIGGCYISEADTGVPPPCVLTFENFEQLPKTVTSLHLKPVVVHTSVVHYQTILSLVQLQWIVSNLKGLESLWVQLAVDEIPDNPDNDDKEYDDQGQGDENALAPDWIRFGIKYFLSNLQKSEDESDDSDEESEPEVDVAPADVQYIPLQFNGLPASSNVDIVTFKNLISMRLLRDVKLDMLKARYMYNEHANENEVNETLQPFQPGSIQDIRPYREICEQDPRIKFSMKRLHSFRYNFIEFSLTRK